jgi:hypothetical protein
MSEDEEQEYRYKVLAERAKEIRALCEPFDKRAVEYSKASVEFSKILVTNLNLINAGGLLATPTIAKFLGFDAMRPAVKVVALTVPSVLFLLGLVCAALCALLAYINFKRHASNEGWLREGQYINMKLHFPLLPGEEPYTDYYQDIAKATKEIDNSRKAINRSYYAGIGFGVSSVIFFVAACCFYGLVLLWPIIKLWWGN